MALGNLPTNANGDVVSINVRRNGNAHFEHEDRLSADAISLAEGLKNTAKTTVIAINSIREDDEDDDGGRLSFEEALSITIARIHGRYEGFDPIEAFDVILGDGLYSHLYGVALVTDRLNYSVIIGRANRIKDYIPTGTAGVAVIAGVGTNDPTNPDRHPRMYMDNKILLAGLSHLTRGASWLQLRNGISAKKDMIAAIWRAVNTIREDGLHPEETNPFVYDPPEELLAIMNGEANEDEDGDEGDPTADDDDGNSTDSN